MSNEKLFWNKTAGIYNFIFAKKKNYRTMYNLISEHLNSSMTVLEVGTGPGLIAREICDSVKSVVATDFSDAMIEQAKKLNNADNIEYAVQDASSLEYKDNSFDAVIIANVLHIVPNPEEIIKELKRVLRKGGIIIAPTFLWKEMNFFGRIKKTIMLRRKFPIYTKWDSSGFLKFLEQQGLQIINKKIIKSAFNICFVVCK
ncbi:MAG: hypothetical protein CR988_07130 [Treponema sp.]|nr:MAG: hypothetical protein CR988_07130 [Treponema sp.]